MSNPETAPLPEEINNPEEPARHLQDADNLKGKEDKEEAGRAWPESYNESQIWEILQQNPKAIIEATGADPDEYAKDVAWALNSGDQDELKPNDVKAAFRFANQRNKK